MRHFLNLLDLKSDDLAHLLAETARLKEAHLRGHRQPLLAGRVLGLIFEKPSLRTRVSFETAIAQLGGASVFLGGKEVGLGSRETVPDFARSLRRSHVMRKPESTKKMLTPRSAALRRFRCATTSGFPVTRLVSMSTAPGTAFSFLTISVV